MPTRRCRQTREARWHRLVGDDVFFLTGTDEHGAKVAEAAAEQGMSPKEWTDRTSRRFQEAWSLLEISNDDFIRTTEDRHNRSVQRFLQQIYDHGYIELGTYRGLYCVSCEDYYTEEQLVDGLCPIHHRAVVPYEEENYFFKLSAFEGRLLEWYERFPDAVAPANRRNEALSFIRSGLRDISITRTSMSWGVTVPWDPKHVFYVWYDALINYCTAVGYGVDDERFATWWPSVHHVIGKEIVKFHCVWWPAMCMAAGIEPPARILVHGWLLLGGEKLSKSRLAEGGIQINEVAPAELTEDFGVDPVRYHLLRDTPFGPDSDFSYERIVSRYNADLANNLGNLVSRVATVVGSKCGGIGPAAPSDSPLAQEAAASVKAAAEAWDRFHGPRGPGRHLAAHWRRQCGAGGHRAVEAATRTPSRPGPGRRAGGSPDRRPADHPGHARGRHRDLATPGPRRARRRTRGFRTTPNGAATRGGWRWRRAPPCSLDGAADVPWFDSHCHVQDRYLEPGAGPGDGRSDDLGTDVGGIDALEEMLEACQAAGVARLVCVGTDPESSYQALSLSRRSQEGVLGAHAPAIWATAGLHPHDAGSGGHPGAGDDSGAPTDVGGGVEAIRRIIDRERSAAARSAPEPVPRPLVAVGECGLDYHYDHSPRDVQRRVLRRAGAARARVRPGARHPRPGGVGRPLRRPGRRGGPRTSGGALLYRRA